MFILFQVISIHLDHGDFKCTIDSNRYDRQ
jgi:hypothetical protein